MASSDLAATIESVFSVLPGDMARQSQAEMLLKASTGGHPFSDDLKWAEFSGTGTLLRLCVTNLHDSTTRIQTGEREDPDIDSLLELARLNSHKPGAISFRPDADRFYWLLPAFSLSEPGQTGMQLRGLTITRALFGDLIQRFNPASTLTDAEVRVAFQVTGGLSLRQAADIDGLSMETKRTQVKAACAKLSCSGQAELVRTLLSQLTHLNRICDAADSATDVAEQFAARFLPPHVELLTVGLTDRERIRYFAIGPKDGRPVVVIHGMMLALPLLGADRVLEAANLRLFMPVRPGYLDPASAADLYRQSGHADRAIETVAMFVARQFNEPVLLAGHSIGGMMAMRLAKDYPHLFSGLALISLNPAEANDHNRGFIGRMFQGLRNLSHRPGLFRLITAQFRRHYADETIVRSILRKMLRASGSDLGVMDGGVGADPIWPWFAYNFRNSVLGIGDDFRFAMTSPLESLLDIQIPVTLIHGLDDPLSPIERLETQLTAGHRDRTVVTFPGGHLICASQAEPVWMAVSRL